MEGKLPGPLEVHRHAQGRWSESTNSSTSSGEKCWRSMYAYFGFNEENNTCFVWWNAIVKQKSVEGIIYQITIIR